jgi:hypothetical protein
MALRAPGILFSPHGAIARFCTPPSSRSPHGLKTDVTDVAADSSWEESGGALRLTTWLCILLNVLGGSSDFSFVCLFTCITQQHFCYKNNANSHFESPRPIKKGGVWLFVSFPRQGFPNMPRAAAAGGGRRSRERSMDEEQQKRCSGLRQH